jgi:hypothetical protein
MTVGAIWKEFGAARSFSRYEVTRSLRQVEREDSHSAAARQKMLEVAT